MSPGSGYKSGIGRKAIYVTLAVAFVYLLVSSLWIAFSDNIAAQIADSESELAMIQRYKGFGFVFLMTLLVGLLVFMISRRQVLLEDTLRHIQTDSVTGLANRAVAEDFLQSVLSHQDRNGSGCGVLLFDIHKLKRINAAIGRAGGDRVLQLTAERLHQHIRPVDLVARLESDKFVVILGALTDEREALGRAATIINAFDTPFLIKDMELKIDLHGGIAIAGKDGKTVFELLDAADRALRRTVLTGSRFERAHADDLHRDMGHLTLENELRRAIREHEFSIALQPQVSLDNFTVSGVEALARWHSDKLGTVSPAEFISRAESLNLVTEITEQILQQVGSLFASWQQRGLPLVPVAVNVSGVDLKSGRLFDVTQVLINNIIAGMKNRQTSGELLTLEITESWLLEDYNSALGLLHRIRGLGARIAIDDFGTGYSALSQLIDFPVDFIKFDRSFVSGIDQSLRKAKVLTAVQQISQTLGARTIAEGVETVEELVMLRQLGVDEAQGFLFARPMTPTEFETTFLQPQPHLFKDIEGQLSELSAKGSRKVTHLWRH